MRVLLKIIQLLPFITLVLYTGCSKEDEYIPGLEGNMVGYVYTYDEFGAPLDDHSRVKITAFGYDGKHIAYSNSDGRFELINLPAGTYELRFEKEGFGTLKQFGVQHLGGKPTILLRQEYGYSSYYIHAYVIYKMPTTEIISVNIENDTIYGEFAFKKGVVQPREMCLRIFFADDPDFTKKSAQFINNFTLYYLNGKYSCSMDFSDMKFQSGIKVFFKACIYTRCTTGWHFNPKLSNYIIVETDTYYDYQSAEIIYPNLSDESEIFSFIYTE